MVSETYKNSQDQALEERLSNLHEQMAGVTSRLDQTERALDLERATREDIIKAEVERRIREAEERIRKEIESEYADEREPPACSSPAIESIGGILRERGIAICCICYHLTLPICLFFVIYYQFLAISCDIPLW